MAISNQIFQAPVPNTYDPSDKIDKAFQRQNQQLGGLIDDVNEKKHTERANFNQMYANLGEIDAKLQEEYAGINQEAVTATKDWLKGQIKEGKSTTDPELIRGLSERTNRIKAGMANADHHREQLKLIGERLKDDRTILDEEKTAGLSLLLNKFQDKDFLISKNKFNAEDFLDDLRNPQLTFTEFAKRVPGSHSAEFLYTDKDGNERIKRTEYGNLVSKENPFDENGNLNIEVTQDIVDAAKRGDFGDSVLKQTKRIVDEQYSDLPIETAFRYALRDGLKMAVGSKVDEKIVKSARQIGREDQQQDLQNQRMQLSINRERRLASKEQATSKSEKEFLGLWDKFVEGYNKADNAILGEFNIPSKTKNASFVTVKDSQEYQDYQKISDPEEWKGLSRDERIGILEKYEVTPPKALGITGRWETEDESARQELLEKLPDFTSTDPDKVISIDVDVAGGMKDGRRQWETETFNIYDESDLENAFRTLENYRRSGKSKLTPTEVPDEVDVDDNNTLKTSDKIDMLP
jgi:hypothetical protein